MPATAAVPGALVDAVLVVREVDPLLARTGVPVLLAVPVQVVVQARERSTGSALVPLEEEIRTLVVDTVAACTAARTVLGG